MAGVAEEDSKDARWVKFEKGYHELVVDLQKKDQTTESHASYAGL